MISGIKKAFLWMLTAFLLCGCTGGAAYTIRPSAVPQKRVTKTAEVPGTRPSDPLPDIASDPWIRCGSVIVSGPSPVKVSEIENEEFRRRTQITFMIGDEIAGLSYIAERCMSGKLYVCLLDGKSNCREKLDFTIEPSEQMREFCADTNREGAILSPNIIGINSAYEWRCHEGTAVITAQIAEPDPDGYDRSIWYEIPAPENGLNNY